MSTYFDYLPNELIAICIPDKYIENFLSLFNNHLELFTLWFNYNYADYFNMLKFDKINYDYNIIIKKLYKAFKYNIKDITNTIFDSDLSLKYLLGNDRYNIYYPIIYQQEFNNLYKEIIKYYQNNQLINDNNILKLSLSFIYLLWYGNIDIITYPINIDLKMLIINSSNINLSNYYINIDDISNYENDEFVKFLIKKGIKYVD